MSARSERPEKSTRLTTRTLLIAAMSLTAVVLALTVAIVVARMGPEREPSTMIGRDLKGWESLAAKNSDAAWAHTGLGIAQIEAGDEAGARESFERALELDPDYWTAGLRLGGLLADSDPERARKLLEHSAEIAPDTEKVEPYVALGNLLLDTGDAKGAKSAFEMAIADVPHIVEARVGLAKALEAEGDAVGALEQYRKAALYDPFDPEVAGAIARLEQGTAATATPSTTSATTSSEES